MKSKILIPVVIISISMIISTSYAWNGDTWGSISRQTITSIASEMIDSSWTPRDTIRNWAYGSTWYYFYLGTIYTGEAYSQHNPQENWSEFFNLVNTTAGGDTYYGNDCSGFVSISWKLPARYTTSTFESDLGGSYFYALGDVDDSPYVSLLKGDALNDDYNHIILFNRYVTSGIESMEQTSSTARRRSWTWSQLSTYRPIRRSLVEDGFKIGNRIQTIANLNVRICASRSCSIIATEPTGAQGTIIDGPQNADKYRWWKINYDDGIIGWSVEGYLVKIGSSICSTLIYPTDRWQRVWYDYNWNCLGDGLDETNEQFDNNWGYGTIAYGKSDYIIFTSSRKIYFPSAGTYRFTVGSDDGVRMWIDGNLKIDKWVLRSYTTDSVDVYLSAGYHDFKINYFESGGEARVSFTYSVVQEPPVATITTKSVTPSTITLGQSFTVSITGKNNGGTAGWGGISVSFPQMVSTGSCPGASYSGSEATVSGSTTLPSLGFYHKGCTIYGTGGAMSAQYLLVEASKSSWGNNESQSMTLTVTPKVTGTFTVYIRMALCQASNCSSSQTISRDPISGSLTDQQGYSVYSFSVTVNPPSDTTPPIPNPMTWSTEPYETSTSSISMIATTASDPSTPISYYFDFYSSPTGGSGGSDSGWQSSTSYTDYGLQANHQYGYRVKAKDNAGNETGYSVISYEYTDIETPSGITFGSITNNSIQVKSSNTPSGLTRGNSGLIIYNVTNGTNSGWKQNNNYWTSSGLSPNTQYGFRAKARNGDGDETGYSPTYYRYTLANAPGVFSFSNVTQTSIRVNWTANGNPAGTQYYAENMTKGTSSGWTTNTYWNETGLTCGTSYTYRVKAKNGDGIETGWTNLGSQATQNCGDTTPPSPGSVTPFNTQYNNFVDSPFDLRTTFTDNESDITSCEYCVSTDGTCDTEWAAATLSGSSPTWTCTKTGITGSNGQILTLNMRATSSGGTGTATAITRTVDSAPPITTDNSSSTWTSMSPVTVTLSPSDGSGSGVASTKYCVDTTNSCTPSNAGTSVDVSCANGSECVQYVRYFSTDNVGNQETTKSSNPIRQDLKTPTDGTLTATPGDKQISLNWSGFSDSGSGLNTSDTYKLVYSTSGFPSANCTDGIELTEVTTQTSYLHTNLENGTTYYYRICAYDEVGNISEGVKRSATPQEGIDLAYQHLYEVMDKYHNSFDVYSDQDAGGNHFYPSGWMGDLSSISFDSNWTSNCYSGTSCIKITFTATGSNWAGIYWQEPENNWGTVPNGGYDISGATKLTFWARGENGGERIEFFVGGITGPYPDSLEKTSTGYITLTSSWQKYTIDLTSKDLSHVIGGFGWVTNSSNNPNGATFYLDEIKYDKSRPDELRFLVSFETLPVIDPDRYIKNASFIYDNALVLLSFLARGNNDDLRRAQILADAFIYAQNNDRYYNDGRLRNAYMSGDLIDHQTGKARLPGWWDPDVMEWYEDEFQVSTYTGNLAWVMIALLNYYKKEGGSQYLTAAETLGEWIERETKDTRCAGGYTGGYQGWEPDPQKITWKSTEHNIDVYVAFMLLYEITGDTKWEDRALHAKNFVDAMWNEVGRFFWTGTLDDGCTINESNIPIDIQAWAIMAMNSYTSALNWAEENCYTEHDGFKGFDFNTDKDGVWFEGTAQMAVACQINGEINKSDIYIAELQKAQVSATNTNGKGIVAACHDGVTTGFGWEYFSRLHIGATAWYIFAEMQYNPYWGRGTLMDSDGDGIPDNQDNCKYTPNPGQEDTDNDGYGNICDCDLDNDGFVGINDFNLFKAAWWSDPSSLNWNPDADFDSDGFVGINDFNILRERWWTSAPWE